MEQDGQPLGIVHEIARLRSLGGGQVALVQQQVDHREDLGQAGFKLIVGRDSVRDSGFGDLPLGAGDPLRHSRFTHQERPGDLGRGQAANDPQGERDLCLLGQRRMAAREDQPQPFVRLGLHRPL
jgi:hypothetical protein